MPNVLTEVSAIAHWQSTMPGIWATQLDNPEQGGRYLDAKGQPEVRSALEGGDFDRLSDAVFLAINRASCEKRGNVWRPMPIERLWTPDPPSEVALARASAKRRDPLSLEARSDIAARFADGHLFGYEIISESTEDRYIEFIGQRLRNFGIQLYIDTSPRTFFVPSLSLLSAIYVHLFGEDALLPLAIGGDIPNLGLHDLHAEGRRGVGLVFDSSVDEGFGVLPSPFAWHDLLHGVLGMLYGDKLLYRLAKHFAYAMADCERRAREIKANFYVSCASQWYDKRRDLSDLFVSRRNFERAHAMHEDFLFGALVEFLDQGEFHSWINNTDEMWQTLFQSLVTRLSNDEELKSDPQALILLKIAEILNPRPAGVDDFDSLLAVWNDRVIPAIRRG